MKIPGWIWIAGAVVLIAGAGASVETGAATQAAAVVLAWWQRSQNAQKWAPVLATAEQAYGLPVDLLARMAYTESAYQQNIIDGTRPSSAGALGILQLEPQYFSTVNRPIPFTDGDTTDQINEAAGQVASLYRQLLPLASSSGQNPWALALAGYDAGAGAVQKYQGIPPFTETQNYVSGILADVPAALSA